MCFLVLTLYLIELSIVVAHRETIRNLSGLRMRLPYCTIAEFNCNLAENSSSSRGGDGGDGGGDDSGGGCVGGGGDDDDTLFALVSLSDSKGLNLL